MKQSSPLAWIRNLKKGSEEAQSQTSHGRKVTFAVPSGWRVCLQSLSLYIKSDL